jgi:glycerol uptake facilitator-like aquaporin
VNVFGYFAAFMCGAIVGGLISALIFAAYYDRKEK